MRALTAVAVIVGLLAGPGLAVAQSGDADGSEDRETTTYDFSGDELEGVRKTGGTLIDSGESDGTSRLIDVRSNFVPEMVETVEDL